jgi:hypothetical protein
LFNFDFKQHPEMSFEVFLVKFESMMIDKIFADKGKLFKDQDSFAELLKVVFKFYDRSLFEQGLAKGLHKALKEGQTAAYTLRDKPDELIKMVN